MQAWFRFNGVDSRDMGIIVTAMPDTVRPEKRVATITIPGRNGSLHMDEGVYESYIRTMECAITKRAGIDEIAGWLVGGGNMVFSTEPDKVYRVIISNKIEIAQMMRIFQKFMITMDTQPFKYTVNAFGDNFTLTNPCSITNKGTVYSEPIITVYGTGNITLTINGTNYGLLGVQESITINSEMMEVYKGNTNCNYKFSAIEFPCFETGENSISWTGTVAKIEVEPNWRWL